MRYIKDITGPAGKRVSQQILTGFSGLRIEECMPRQVRIEYPGAVYDVTAWGDRREGIFSDEKDREMCSETWLRRAADKVGGQYCENCHVGHVVADDVIISAISEGVRGYALDSTRAWYKVSLVSTTLPKFNIVFIA